MQRNPKNQIFWLSECCFVQVLLYVGLMDVFFYYTLYATGETYDTTFRDFIKKWLFCDHSRNYIFFQILLLERLLWTYRQLLWMSYLPTLSLN